MEGRKTRRRKGKSREGDGIYGPCRMHASSEKVGEHKDVERRRRGTWLIGEGKR